MMRSEFIEQVQVLMEIQQMKNAEKINENRSNYYWLCSKKFSYVWISVTEEYKLWQALGKISADEQVQILKQTVSWIEAHPGADPLKIPEVTLTFINSMVIKNVINRTNFSRMASFRNSLRKLSLIPNRVAPMSNNLYQNKPRRSVTFNDIPIIYKISK